MQLHSDKITYRRIKLELELEPSSWNLSSFQLKNFFKFVLAWLPRAQQNILTLKPCLHTLMQTHLSANQSARTIFYKQPDWSSVSLSKHTSEFRQRRFSATHVNRKLDGTKFVLLNVFTLIEPVYSVGSKSRLQSAQNSTSGWKRRCLNFLLCWQKRCCLWSWSVLTNGTPGSILQNY